MLAKPISACPLGRETLNSELYFSIAIRCIVNVFRAGPQSERRRFRQACAQSELAAESLDKQDAPQQIKRSTPPKYGPSRKTKFVQISRRRPDHCHYLSRVAFSRVRRRNPATAL